MKRKQINSTHLSFICPMKRSDFQQAGSEYFCDKCQKQVFDLTDCTLDDVITLQRERGVICGIVRVVGAASLMSLTSCAGTIAAPDKLTDPAVIGTIPISSVEDGKKSEPATDGNHHQPLCFR